MAEFGSQRVPSIAAIAVALLLGTTLAEYTQIPSAVVISMCWVQLITVIVLWRRSLQSLSRVVPVAITILIFLLAMVRWDLSSAAFQALPVHQLAQQGTSIVEMELQVDSVPFEFKRPGTTADVESPENRWQTRFIATCISVNANGSHLTTSGALRVFVDGRAAEHCRRGDVIRLPGRLSWPDKPGNPGEFDFDSFLRQRRVAAQFFVQLPDAITVTQPVSRLHPGYWLTVVRQDAERTLREAVSFENQTIAYALLLGSRTGIPAETEEMFISSGTMHLLAISGLHIGMLYLLLIRLGHWLLIPWNLRLVLIAVFCVFYALVTDLRPSVVRATVFVVLFSTCQISLRNVAFTHLISLTACSMLLWQPHLVFDTGAWLSFLSVISLAHATRQIPDTPTAATGLEYLQPGTSLTPRERLRQCFAVAGIWLLSRYRPMLWILAATVPLTAAAFNVVSPITLLVNVVLIGWTAATLWLGFLTMAVGMLMPQMPNILGVVFSGMLTALQIVVEAAADVGMGHLYIPNLPVWFLPAWYLLLAAAMSVRYLAGRQIVWLGLAVISLLILSLDMTRQTSQGIRCNVLDIGHGSAAAVECPDGRLLLVDAGALQGGQRAGNIVSRFLWSRGHRCIHSIVVSHADVDHFNALPTLMNRFPVGELLVSRAFTRNPSPAAQRLLQQTAQQQIPIRILQSDSVCRIAQLELELLQASAARLQQAKSDNEKSVLVQLTYAGKSICLPGDAEGDALTEVLASLTPQDVLVSPHHGSLNANTVEVAERLMPSHLIVSAGTDRYRDPLERIYAGAKPYFTSECGAVAIQVSSTGQLTVTPHRQLSN